MADKTKTIKNATDVELDELMVRLRKENEVQNLIGDLMRKGLPYNIYSESVASSNHPGISTEVPIESLYHKTDETLAHFGVLGMHWGVRRPVGPDGLIRSSKRPLSEDYLRAKELKKRKVQHLSNKEIQDINTRLNLEKSLRDLKFQDLIKGQDRVKAILGLGTTITSIIALGSTPGGKAIKAMVTNAVQSAALKAMRS